MSGRLFACPACGRPIPMAEGQRPTTFPFCSSRCRLLDLGAWADGRHVIPGRSLGSLPDADQEPDPV